MRSRCLIAAAAALLLALLLALPSGAAATVLSPWGSSLAATPTRDTANGALGSDPFATNKAPTAVAPNPHEAEDTAVWNTVIASSATAAVAPADGQALEIRVKGCAIKDTTSPSQLSQGVPVNTVVFQVLTKVPNRDSTWSSNVTSGRFLMPFCGDPNPAGGTYTNTTISSFVPVHMCLKTGDTIAFHDIGGFVGPPEFPNSAAHYPQGVPFQVIAPTDGGPLSSTASFTGVNTTTYGPGQFGTPEPDQSKSGFGQVRSEELLLQVVEGTGEDAYGVCGGGRANEPDPNSNAITCVFGTSTEGHPVCTGPDNTPTLPPSNQTPPSISGTPQAGQTLTLSQGSWSYTDNAAHPSFGAKITDQWQDCDSGGANCSAISGATGPTYQPTSSDVGHTIRVSESASNKIGSGGSVVSGPTGAVSANPSPDPGPGPGPGPTPQPGSPVLSGLKLSDHRGEVLIHYVDSLSGTTMNYVILTTGKKPKIVKRGHHFDRGGKTQTIAIKGLKSGTYVIELTSTLQSNHTLFSPTLSVKFKFKAAKKRH